MPFRKRAAEPSPENDPEAAEVELHRATDAVRYWKQEQTEAIEEIAGLEGVGGWIAALTGKKQQYLKDAHQRLAHAKLGFKKERAALVAATETAEKHQQRQAEKEQIAQEHAIDLEQVAEDLRNAEHPQTPALNALEEQLNQISKELVACQEVIAAAGAVNSGISQLKRAAIEAQSRMTGMLGAAPIAASALKRLPKSLARFDKACIEVAIEPLNITVSGMAEGILTDDHLLSSLQSKVYDDRATITQIQIQAAAMRVQCLARQKVVFAERHALLEQMSQ